MKRDLDEIEVDLTAPVPLNKKQKRLLKKGKIDEPQPVDLNADSNKPKPRSQYSVWIGNLSYDTDTEKLRKFIIENTESLEVQITSEDITRIKLPPKKGFAYVDLKTEEQMQTVVKLSESRLDNRNLLIKPASSFEGRPEEHQNGQKNPPSRVLFVGNLSFDTVDSELEMLFQHCGEIRRIRTATFQDTGKCKGFTFIDFKTEEAATKAIKDKSCHRLHGRSLRLEYGEDRSNRRPKINKPEGEQSEQSQQSQRSEGVRERNLNTQKTSEHSYQERPKRTERPRERRSDLPRARPTPGEALKNAQRAKQSIVPSQGKKVSFD